MSYEFILRCFEQYFLVSTGGPIDFTNEEFVEQESYRNERSQEMSDWFLGEGYRKLVDEHEWSLICNQVLGWFKFGQGEPVHYAEYQWIGELRTETDQKAFVDAMHGLLFGTRPMGERIDEFVSAAEPLYQKIREIKPKFYTRKGLTWPFVTYLPFMVWPEPDPGYPFVKPRSFKFAAQQLGLEIGYKPHPNGDTYVRARDLYRHLWPKVAEIGGSNWIDVSTFIYMSDRFSDEVDDETSDTLSSDESGSALRSKSFANAGRSAEVGSEDPTVAAIVDLLENKGQVVLYGPPGTGKTYTARRVARQMLRGEGVDLDHAATDRSAQLSERPLGLVGATGQTKPEGHFDHPSRPEDIEKARITMVQFHPSYTYEDFVAGLVADPSGEGFTFTAQNKVFRELCETAQSQKPSPFVLLIDEINRADMAKVFGELIYALEYRDEPVETVYQVGDSKEMVVPANLYIIGTMNTADKSIAMLDYALRRRFVFYPLYPDERVIEGYYGDAYPRTRAAAFELFRAVAGCFTAKGNDLQVGHTYFLVGAPGLENPGRLYSHGGVDDPGRQLDDDDAYRLLRQKFVFEVAPLVHEYVLAGEDGLDSANVRPIRAAYDEPTKAPIALEVLFEKLVVPKEIAAADDLGPVKDDEAADEQG